MSSTAPAAAGLPPVPAEAARYALLRRLAPSMRHHLVVNLQPIGMIYEVMDRRLRQPTPDIAHVQDSAGKINGFARAALASCLDVVSWLAPDDTVSTTPGEGVRECSALLATSLSFRGYALRNQCRPLTGSIRRSAVRNLLSATLLHCTDHLPGPAELVLTCGAEGAGAVITITHQKTDAARPLGVEANYRKIEWEDLQALAAADGVQLVRAGERIELRLPWVGGA
ncbi:MAG TPA: hypothetical protein VHL79_22100 [Ramlibacter sp.]|jgi:hypothetical protein|nr:hypothetical protein [Ramlibacter sp.]